MSDAPRAHMFASSGEAYDACQCDDTIKNGDLLFVPAENLVGIADTWPVAVTVAAGELHTIATGETFHAWSIDRRITAAQVASARAMAMKHGFPLHEAFQCA